MSTNEPWLLEVDLYGLLGAIEDYDRQGDYTARNETVLEALGLAKSLGYAGGIRVDPAEPEWPVVYIELPTGQVSWHLPQYEKPWDGHTTEEKYTRIREYIRTHPVRLPGSPPPSRRALH